MATIKYFIQSKNNPVGIYVRLKEGRIIDAKAKTNYIINHEDWSSAKGLPKDKDENLKVLKDNLDDLRTKLQKQYNKDVDNKIINSQWLKEVINPPKEVAIITDELIKYFDYFALHKKTLNVNSTYKRNNVYKRLIERFEKSIDPKSKFLIKDVDADFKLKFETYCTGQGYAPNTIARTIKFLKTLCYHARSNKIETSFQLDEISVKINPVDKIFLTSIELERIEKTQFEADYLQNAKDWLIISCETGQRVSDFLRFTKEQIRIENKVTLIEFTQVKTGKIMAIPLSSKVRNILAKREGNFPRKISDQRYNEYIKDVCRIAGITEKIHGSKKDKETNRKVTKLFPKYELVSSHIGRRSFATNNYGNIPTSLLKNVTGHSTETMFLEYIGKSETEKAKQLAKYIK